MSGVGVSAQVAAWVAEWCSANELRADSGGVLWQGAKRTTSHAVWKQLAHIAPQFPDRAIANALSRWIRDAKPMSNEPVADEISLQEFLAKHTPSIEADLKQTSCVHERIFQAVSLSGSRIFDVKQLIGEDSFKAQKIRNFLYILRTKNLIEGPRDGLFFRVAGCSFECGCSSKASAKLSSPKAPPARSTSSESPQVPESTASDLRNVQLWFDACVVKIKAANGILRRATDKWTPLRQLYSNYLSWAKTCGAEALAVSRFRAALRAARVRSRKALGWQLALVTTSLSATTTTTTTPTEPQAKSDVVKKSDAVRLMRVALTFWPKLYVNEERMFKQHAEQQGLPVASWIARSLLHVMEQERAQKAPGQQHKEIRSEAEAEVDDIRSFLSTELSRLRLRLALHAPIDKARQRTVKVEVDRLLDPVYPEKKETRFTEKWDCWFDERYSITKIILENWPPQPPPLLPNVKKNEEELGASESFCEALDARIENELYTHSLTEHAKARLVEMLAVAGVVLFVEHLCDPPLRRGRRGSYGARVHRRSFDERQKK